jgi:Domain of Unknown Function (DUF1206)
MLERLARLGYASKAVIYGVVGVFAILAALNRGGLITDTGGAPGVVLKQPFGRMLLVVLAIGLCGYGAWRVLDAASDPDREGTSPVGLVNRIGNVLRGLFYGGLGLEAIRLLRGFGRSNNGNTELWAARILDWPLGEVVVGVAGAVIAAYGVSEVMQGIGGTAGRKLDWSPVPPDVRPLIKRISRFGVAVRGGLMVTLGVFLVRAALTHDPNQAADQRESLLRLGGLFDGRWFLALVAAGVLAYAIDQAIHARCRRIRPVL